MKRKRQIGYQYVTLAEHPGKLFRIRCEEISDEARDSLVAAFVPSKEKVYECLNRSITSDHTRKWVGKPIVNTVAPAPIPIPPKKTWRTVLKSIVNYFDLNSEIRKKQQTH